jgi:hypothetical protein
MSATPRAATPPIDPILQPFLQAPDDGVARQAVDDVLNRHLAAVIRVAVARYLHPPAGRPGAPPDAAIGARLQARAEAHVAARLAALRRGAGAAGEARALGDVRAWAARIAARVCEGWIRRRDQSRTHLLHRLRYLLAHDRRFLLRPTPDEAWRCGLAARDARSFASGEAAGPGRRIPEATPGPHRPSTAALPAPGVLGDLAADLLATAGGPVDLGHLVDAIADHLGLAAGEACAPGEDDARLASPVAIPPADPAAWLRRLWDEINRLSPLERTALILNLRDADGRGVLGLFPVGGVAGLRAIAAAAGMPPERLAEQWRTLPLEDATIAARLGLPRPQVIRLRRVARERLARRMEAPTA